MILKTLKFILISLFICFALQFSLFANWNLIYSTDFSTDPGWITNDPSNLYWDSTAKNYHGWQSNTNTSYSYIPIDLNSDFSFRLEYDCKIESVEWSAGLTFGLFDSRLLFHYGAGVDYSFTDTGYTTALWVGDPCSVDCWEESNWQTGVWYTNVIEYNEDTRVITFESRRRDTGVILSQLSINMGSDVFPPGMTRLGVSRLHMEGYNNYAVEYNIDNVYVYSTQCRITLTSPNGGENLQKGATHDITWSSSGNVGDVRITLWKGNSFYKVIKPKTPNDGSYLWTIPKRIPNQSYYRIRINSKTDGSFFDFSDGYFTISSP